MTNETLDRDRNDTNRDPITGALGAHPVGPGLGAAAGGLAGGVAAGAVAGAVTGTVVGPVGTAIGAVVGAVAGGLAGKGVAEVIDPTAEDAYWRDDYSTRPYAAGGTYDDYGPAYRYGVDGYGQYKGRTFEEAEPELMRDWQGAKGSSKLTWDNAKHATRDSWQAHAGGRRACDASSLTLAKHPHLGATVASRRPLTHLSFPSVRASQDVLPCARACSCRWISYPFR